MEKPTESIGMPTALSVGHWTYKNAFITFSLHFSKRLCDLRGNEKWNKSQFGPAVRTAMQDFVLTLSVRLVVSVLAKNRTGRYGMN